MWYENDERRQIGGKLMILFFFIFVVSLFILAISSGTFLVSTFNLNPTAEPAGIVITLTIAILFSLNLRIYLQKKQTSGALTLGGLFAFFTSACPICQPIWLIWLGFGTVTAFLVDYTIYLGLLSIVLLLVALHYSLKKTCEVEKWKKS